MVLTSRTVNGAGWWFSVCNGPLQSSARSCRRIMEKEAEKVAWVKALYEELNLQAIFTQYEEDSYSLLMGLVEQHSLPLPPVIFLRLAHKTYKCKN